MGDPPEQPGFEIQVPSELEAGDYANFLSVWHTVYEFTMDFGVTLPHQVGEAGAPVKLPARVVARIKIPPTLVFNVLRALNENMTNYERAFGEIKRPESQEQQP